MKKLFENISYKPVKQGCKWHYQRTQEVLTSNKRHLHQGRDPGLFQALQRPTESNNK